MYKSCCVPNSSTDDISPPRDHIHFRPNNIDKTDYSICLEASSKKAKIVLVILFLICLGLYGYVIIDGDSASLKNDSQNQMAKDKTNSCFEDFRKHNCTIGKPMSEVCEQLYACVRKTTSEGKGEIDVSTKKIDRIEQSLENILLWVGGLGVGSMLGKMALKSRRLLKKMMKLCSRASEFLNTLKDKDKHQRIEQDEEKETVDRKLTEFDADDEDDDDLLR